MTEQATIYMNDAMTICHAMKDEGYLRAINDCADAFNSVLEESGSPEAAMMLFFTMAADYGFRQAHISDDDEGI